MPDLRSHVRETLARTEPSEREARADLQEILAKRRRPRRLIYAGFAGVAVAAAIAFLIVRRPLPAPPPTARAGVHLYLHVAGEPPEKALALDLTSIGEH